MTEGAKVSMPINDVWMTKEEISDMFGLPEATIYRTIRAIYKNKELSPPEKVVFLRSILAYATILGDTRQKSDPVKIFSKIIAMQPNAPLRGLKRANIGL